MNINYVALPDEVSYILRKLNIHNHKAYIVGGCVRDSILQKSPKDWDITTSATPLEIKAIFDKTIDTGIKHGTVTVVVNNINFEITTFRIEGKYINNRKPEKVDFTSSLDADLSRRDFTSNAIAYHPEFGFIDPFNGKEDIKNKIIRAVGNADERFQEDALRMLRAIRFSAQLNFTLDSDTLHSIGKNSPLITNISCERIREELTGILVSDSPIQFLLLKDTGLLNHIMPEFEECFHTTQDNPYHIYNVAHHTLHAVSTIEKDKILRWTMLLHDTGKPLTKTNSNGKDHFYGHQIKSVEVAKSVLSRLKFDNASINKICRLIEHHDRRIEPEFKPVRKALNVIGDDIFLDFLKVKEADMKAQNPEYLGERLVKLNKIKDIYKKIKESRQCFTLNDLAVNGQDLIELGYKQNKEIGVVLKRLLDVVIEEPELNKKEILLNMLKIQKNSL